MLGGEKKLGGAMISLTKQWFDRFLFSVRHFTLQVQGNMKTPSKGFDFERKIDLGNKSQAWTGTETKILGKKKKGGKKWLTALWGKLWGSTLQQALG